METALIDWAVAITVAYLRPWAQRRIVIEASLVSLMGRGKLTAEQAGAARRALLLVASTAARPVGQGLRRQA
ncbi:MAG: hypothetical protein FJZ01_16580 [Candidatus Sericytochromatia bacterium]|nr:hypothetical protein [Candidatus Tanganyikabacteria bacterium]